MVVEDLPSRLASKILIDPVTGCWEWMAYRDSRGYGLFSWRKRMSYAHRVTYHLLVDPACPVNPGRGSNDHLDHLCRNTSCANPAHLERVSHRTNNTRGRRSALNGSKTSRFTGVSWSKRRRKWIAQAHIDGKDRYLGSFEDEVEAAMVYQAAITGDPLMIDEDAFR